MGLGGSCSKWFKKGYYIYVCNVYVICMYVCIYIYIYTIASFILYMVILVSHWSIWHANGWMDGWMDDAHLSRVGLKTNALLRITIEHSPSEATWTWWQLVRFNGKSMIDIVAYFEYPLLIVKVSVLQRKRLSCKLEPKACGPRTQSWLMWYILVLDFRRIDVCYFLTFENDSTSSFLN
jgi:hypothetical protein